jgi:hypothetical protein
MLKLVTWLEDSTRVLWDELVASALCDNQQAHMFGVMRRESHFDHRTAVVIPLLPVASGRVRVPRDNPGEAPVDDPSARGSRPRGLTSIGVLNGCVWVLDEFWNCQGLSKRRGCHFLRASYQILRRKLANRVSPPLLSRLKSASLQEKPTLPRPNSAPSDWPSPLGAFDPNPPARTPAGLG